MEDLEKNWKGVRVVLKDSVLEADTGACKRVWKIENGLRTLFFGHGETNLVTPSEDRIDWKVSACPGDAVFQDFQCVIHSEDYRSGEFLQIFLTFLYPATDILLRYEIDCWPDAPGFRTQLAFKSTVPIPPAPAPGRHRISGFVDGYSESFVIDPAKFRRTAFGYACDSQHRYSLNTPILSEIRREALPVRTTENYDNSNGLILTDCGGHSLILVKESHKCTNCSGVYTGSFILHSRDVCVTGLGFSQWDPYWVDQESFHEAWAGWCIYSESGEYGATRALKEFDRFRYPFRTDRDMLIAADLWGSRGSGELSRGAAEEQNIIRELASCADLGIDLLQIDDGWEFDPGTSDFNHCPWTPSKIRFPHGWTEVRRSAEKLNMKLGIWFPWSVSQENIMRNVREADFKRIKLDFADITRRCDLDALMAKTDSVVRESPAGTAVNWDITEITPRTGFFFGRDFGNIFLQNCENSAPGCFNMEFVGYDPEVSLRQIWMLGKYRNLNQCQITVQRVADSPHGKGYPQEYAFAIAMTGIPLFFTETCRFTAAERKELKSLIAVYRKYREAILHSYVVPIGDEPFGCSWTGFQCITGKNEGVLLLFREKDAEQETGRFRLEECAGKLHLTALHHGKDTVLDTDSAGNFELSGLGKATFAFYRYAVER